MPPRVRAPLRYDGGMRVVLLLVIVACTEHATPTITPVDDCDYETACGHAKIPHLDYCEDPGPDDDGCCELYLGCDVTGLPTCTNPPAGTCYELHCPAKNGEWFTTGACR